MKIKWDDFLKDYKGSKHNMGDVVRFAQNTGFDVPEALEAVQKLTLDFLSPPCYTEGVSERGRGETQVKGRKGYRSPRPPEV